MTGSPSATPYGTPEVSGIVSRRSPLPFAQTVERLEEVMQEAGAKVFAAIDQKAQAVGAGLSLRDTTLVIFGNPQAGTRVMEAVPLAALDLPLKVLVWADDAGVTWMSFLSAAWLADRYDIPVEAAQPLSAVDVLTSRVASSG
jgi:uncharacterized protein (DUF302 family)